MTGTQSAAFVASDQGYNPPDGPSYPDAARTLRQVREAAGLSIREVERRSGVSRGSLSMIERGRQIATPGEASKIAEALGLEPGSLVTRTLLVWEAEASRRRRTA